MQRQDTGAWDPAGDPRRMIGGAKHKWLVWNREKVLREMQADGLFWVCDRYRLDYSAALRFAWENGLTGLVPRGRQMFGERR